MDNNSKIIENNSKETNNEETILVIEDSDNGEISPGFQDNQYAEEDLNTDRDRPVIMDDISKVVKPTPAVMGDIAKVDINLKEQISEAKSTGNSDEDVIIIKDINLKEQARVDQAKSTKNQTDARPYKCDACDKTYFLLRSLNAHNKRCHKKEKPFQCNYCEQQFSTIGNLHKHIVIHSAAQPYKCGLCGKSFDVMKNLGYHFKVHRDGPPGTPLYTL